MKEEIKTWLKRLGFSRDWLADKIGVSKRTVDNWLSSNIEIPERSATMIRQMIDDSEKIAEGITTNVFSVECTLDQFRRFSRAALSDGLILEDWALRILDAEAANYFNLSSQEPLKIESVSTLQSHELPLLRAAAGSPIIADAEMVEVERDYGQGRFILELRGDSMEPQFQDRQRVILRDIASLKRPVLKYGELYCFVHNGQACFKQWAKGKVLHSFNVEYEDIPADEETSWIGWYDPADNQ